MRFGFYNSLAVVVSIYFLQGWLQPVLADEITLINGDRISGTFISQEDGMVSFKSQYAGDISVKWEHVRELRTEEPMLIELSDEEFLTVNTIRVEEGNVMVQADGNDAAREIEIGKLTTILPESKALEQGWVMQGLFNIALKYERGNSDTDNTFGDFDLRFRKDVDRFRLTGQLDKEKVDGESTVQKWFVALNYNHFVSSKWYYGASFRLEHDEFADLDERITLGPFVGHQFYESVPMNLLVELGLMYVHERFEMQPDDDFWGPSWHILFDKYIIGDGLQFYHEQRGVLNAEDTGDLLWDSWTGFRVPLFSGLVGSAEIEVDYNSEPPVGVDSTSTTYRLKLGYQW